jgi:hypothetical protein
MNIIRRPLKQPKNKLSKSKVFTKDNNKSVGRPKGSLNKTTLMFQEILKENADEIIKKAMDMAKAGDQACLKMMVDRINPLMRGQLITMDLPKIVDRQSLSQAYDVVINTMSEGRITADEALAILNVFDKKIKILDGDLTEELLMIKRQLGMIIVEGEATNVDATNNNGIDTGDDDRLCDSEGE